MDRHHDTCEAELWRAVIRQLIEDCQRNFDKVSYGYYKCNTYRIVRKDPERYQSIINSEHNQIIYVLHSEWFHTMCFYAGLQPKKVRQKCYDIIHGKDKYPIRMRKLNRLMRDL